MSKGNGNNKGQQPAAKPAPAATEEVKTDEKPKTEGPTKPTQEIKVEVGRRLSTYSTAVKDRIVDALYEEEVKKRTDAATRIFQEIGTKEKELAKINRPDNVVFDADKKPIQEGYSKERLEAIQKLKEEIEKLESKLRLAFEKGDWSKVLGG